MTGYTWLTSLSHSPLHIRYQCFFIKQYKSTTVLTVTLIIFTMPTFLIIYYMNSYYPIVNAFDIRRQIFKIILFLVLKVINI